jgi:Double-GTPase 2
MNPFGAQTVPCPYCYNKIDPSKVAYQCTGRRAPGRPQCPKAEDQQRVAELGDATPVYPSFMPERNGLLRKASFECPRCSGSTSIRVCQVCHSILPANFTLDSPLFGLVGVRGSGKTVMLTVLTQELTTSVARRFRASIDTVGSSSLLTKLRVFRAEMTAGGRHLPGQTGTYSRAETVPAVFEWQLPRESLGGTRTASTILSFYDTSGEDLSSVDSAREQHYLSAADGLILLLDPFGFPANRDKALGRGVDPENLKDEPRSVLRNVTELLRTANHLPPNKKIKRPLAIVLAKIDAFFDQVDPDHPIRKPSATGPYFSEQESLDLHNHVAALVSEWGGDDVLNMLSLNYTTYRFFVASALGAEPDYRAGTVSGRGLMPHRVAEPLLWLMARRKFIRADR